ncbi:MAG TPA: phosphoribosylglycinamide formyltransferase [Caulobacteraceae bacterium]|jgi:phosphoribosylglycinamide formyltransferase-1|nr:phosphoribosylglycinamide formyltransferase [Caulobacteraceae bacterium]
MINLAFLASNNGSGMRAVIAAIEAGHLAARPVLAVSNRQGAPALDFAREHGVATLVIPTIGDPAAADARLAVALADAGADLVVLSGYLRKLGPRTLAAYGGRTLNIHPALLPSHGGAGMYGRRVHEAVIAAGETISGASVHLVDDEYDHGPVLAQVEVPVIAADDAQSLEARVTAAEPRLLVETLRRIASGDLRLVQRIQTLG